MNSNELEETPLLQSYHVRSLDAVETFPVIHTIRHDIMFFIDTPLTYQALIAPDMTYSLIRPLQEKYGAIQRNGNKSVVFCILINRVHFLRDDNINTRTLSACRAEVCEILATRLLREIGNSILDLTLALTTSWNVYSGADEILMRQALEERDNNLEERVGNAIEMAIISKAKRFIKSSACQKVIDAIWTGKCVYQAESNHSILSDTYKQNPIHFYDVHKAPILDHYRLKVPAIRSVLEYLNFVILFVLFVVAVETSDVDSFNAIEIGFMIYAFGFCLEKVAAMQEHGFRVYFKGTYNGFDLAFVTTFLIYAIMRTYGIFGDHQWSRHFGSDLLSVIACLMFPRLAFVTLKNNLMVLSLRAMLSQFITLMFIAAFCFFGFLYALWTLSRNEAGYSAGTIAWWMLDLWFGLDASGFHHSTEFHQVFGPMLFVIYACLSNTLLLTVLVSILSHTFATINEDAAAEALFRKAVSTIEGVKADSLFSYQPPINILAVAIMLPMRLLLNPRWFHKLNVLLIRLTNFPILLLIGWYEREVKRNRTSGWYDTISASCERLYETLPRTIKRRLTFFEVLAGSEGDIDAVFEIGADTESDLGVDDHGVLPTIDENGQMKKTPGSRRQSMISFDNADAGIRTSIGRTRTQSLLHRGVDIAHVFASPLAQIFHPLNVGNENSVADSASNFGAWRGHIPIAQGQNRSDSMEDHVKSPRGTAEDLGEEGTGSASDAVRLQRLEDGQKRIEELLLKVLGTR